MQIIPLMSRFILFFVTIQLFTLYGFGQEQKFARKYSGTVKYQKTEQPATVFEFNYPASEVEDGLMEFFMNQGSKPKESKGFYYVSGVKISKEDSKFFDVYYKVEKDGKTASKVYAIVTDLGEDPLTRTSSHNALRSRRCGSRNRGGCGAGNGRS